MSMKRELWLEYRKTSKEFSRALQELRQMADSGQTGPAVDLKLEEVKQTRLAHTTARDRLAQYLSAGRRASEEQRIRQTARLIWEFSGKPPNSAESDWHRAEQLVRTASV
jgi:hypothetical protein